MTGKEIANKILRTLLGAVAVVDVGGAGTIAVPADSYKDVTVTFNKTFTENPFVLCGFNTDSVAGAFGRCNVVYLTGSITKTGCKLRVYNGDTTQRSPSLNWMAVSLKLPG